MKQPVLENAKRIHEENPKTFPRDLTGLAIGTFVKVCQVNIAQPERFWVRVDEMFEDGRVAGPVFNRLQFSELKHGDVIDFDIDCIYAVWTEIAEEGTEEGNIRDVHKECNAT
jgi:hypothetical protein